MKNKWMVFTAAVCVVLGLFADTQGTATSGAAALDLATGTVTYALSEAKTVSVDYGSLYGDVEDGTAQFLVNGTVKASGGTASTTNWKPTEAGTYTLEHRMVKSGSPVGTSLSVTHVVTTGSTKPETHGTATSSSAALDLSVGTATYALSQAKTVSVDYGSLYGDVEDGTAQFCVDGEVLAYGGTASKTGWRPTAAGTYVLEHRMMQGDEEVGTTLSVLYEVSADMWTVTFDANGGTSDEQTREVEGGETLGWLPSAEKRNAEFLGWFTAKTGGTQVTEETIITKDVTFYAHWLDYKTVKLSVGNGFAYDPETGDPVSSVSVLSGSSVGLAFDSSKIYDSRGNQVGAFQKWVVEPVTADLGDEFDPFSSETTVRMPDIDVKVTAQYVTTVAAYVAYELNCEGSSEEETYFYWSPDGGKTLLESGRFWPLAAGDVTASFFAFSANGKASSAWKVPANVKLTVPKRGSWTEKEEDWETGKMITVTYYDDPAEITEREWFVAADGAKLVKFDANGGKASVASRWFVEGGTYYLLADVGARQGYVFDGWWTAKTGGVLVNQGDGVDFSLLSSKSPTLYAHWLKAYTLTLKGSGLTVDGADYRNAVSVLQGREVSIGAPGETEGKGGATYLFQKWAASKSADLGENFDAGASDTSLVMPAADVTLTVTYVDAEKAAWLTMEATAEAQEVSGDFTLEPDFSRFQWSTDGKTWYRSGARALLEAGKVTVQWRSLSDSWIAPTKKQTFALTAGDDRYESSDAFTYVPVLVAHAGVYKAADGAWHSSDAGGTVSISPTDGRLLPGKSVTLTAKAAKGFVFVGWAYRDYICCAPLDAYAFAGTSATLKVAETPTEWISSEDGKVHYAAVFRSASDYSDENMDDVFGVLPATGLVGTSGIEVDNDSPYVDCLTYVGCAVGIDVLAGCKPTAWPLAFKTGGTLPKGLKFDTKTGFLSGTPTQTGSSRFSVTVTDPAGHARTLVFLMEVRPMPVAGEYRALLTGNDIGGIPAAALLELSVTAAGKASAKVTGMEGNVSCTPSLTIEEGMFVFSFDGVVGKTVVSLSVNTGVCEDGTETGDGSAHYSAYAKGGSLPCCSSDGRLYGSIRRTDKTRSVAAFAGKYSTAVLSAGSYDGEGEGRWRNPSELAANGYLTVTVDAKGAVKYAGLLADGEKLSGSGTLLVDEYGESAETLLFVAPSGYKKKGFAALRLQLSSDGGLSSSEGIWRVPPLLDTPTDYEWGDGDTSAFLPGLLSLSAGGSVYSKLDDLTDYYMGVSLSAAASPQMELTTTYSAEGEKWTEYSYVDALLAFGNPVLTGGKVTIGKSAAPWKDSEGRYHYDETKEDRCGETQEITNPSGLTLSFKSATGIFSGKFNIFFDWETYKWNAKTEEETTVCNHQSASVSYTGVVVNDGSSAHGYGTGTYAGKVTFPYYNAKGQSKTKTYTRKTALSVDWSF